jgi:prepilin-type N-terminal cleavage/methylation domain-containing protein
MQKGRSTESYSKAKQMPLQPAILSPAATKSSPDRERFLYPPSTKGRRRGDFKWGRGGISERGFTLLELLWVLLILSILLSVVVPNFSGALFQMGLENKAREIFAALAYTQQQSLNQNDTFGIFFDMTAGNQEVTCYRRKGFDAHGVPIVDPNNVLMNPLTHKPYVIEVNHEGLSSDTCIAEADFGGNHWVEFNPLAEPNHEGQAILSGVHSSYTITVSRIGRLSFSGH